MNWNPGSPTPMYDKWSVPPVLLIVSVFIPISLNGPIHASKIGRSASMPCR